MVSDSFDSFDLLLWFPKIHLIFKEYARTDRNEVLSSND